MDPLMASITVIEGKLNSLITTHRIRTAVDGNAHTKKTPGAAPVGEAASGVLPPEAGGYDWKSASWAT